MDVPTDPHAEMRLAIAREIAEGSKLFGAEGVFFRLCAISDPHIAVDFIHSEGKRGTPASDVMEGIATHIANQVLHTALQTDDPTVVSQMLIRGVAAQVQSGLHAHMIGVVVEDDGRQQEVTLQGVLRGAHG